MGQQNREPTDRSYDTLYELPGFPDFPEGLNADNLSALPIFPTSEQMSFAPEQNSLSRSGDGKEDRSRHTAIMNLLAQLGAPSNSRQQPETSSADQLPEQRADDLRANAVVSAASRDNAAEPSHPLQDTLPVSDASDQQAVPMQLTNENLTNFNFITPSEEELALGLLPGQTMVPVPDGLETAMLQHAEVSRIHELLPPP